MPVLQGWGGGRHGGGAKERSGQESAGPQARAAPHPSIPHGRSFHPRPCLQDTSGGHEM